MSLQVPSPGAEQVTTDDYLEYRPSPAAVELLLSGLRRLLDDAEGDGTLDEELFGECQAELARLGAIAALSEPQAETAVALLYRWNNVTQAARRHGGLDGQPAGLYPDPTGRYRKRYWDGLAWGTGVGRPKKP